MDRIDRLIGFKHPWEAALHCVKPLPCIQQNASVTQHTTHINMCPLKHFAGYGEECWKRCALCSVSSEGWHAEEIMHMCIREQTHCNSLPCPQKGCLLEERCAMCRHCEACHLP